jgi:acyl carrier protein
MVALFPRTWAVSIYRILARCGNVTLMQHSAFFFADVFLRADFVVWIRRSSTKDGGLVMNVESTKSSRPAGDAISTTDVRTFIANHLGVDIKRVTDEAHFTEDLGADWLDRLELMIVIGDRFDGIEIADDEMDRIDVVGDLIRYIESSSVAQIRQRGRSGLSTPCSVPITV